MTRYCIRHKSAFLLNHFSGKEVIKEEPISLDQYKGKYLYLDFWGTWCQGCIDEIPNLKSTYAQIDTSKIEFLGIANDNEEDLKAYIEENELNWKQLCTSESNRIDKLYNIQSYPTTFLIDPEGRIVASNLRGEDLLDTLNTYLK
jgi:peroxiredoxin